MDEGLLGPRLTPVPAELLPPAEAEEEEMEEEEPRTLQIGVNGILKVGKPRLAAVGWVGEEEAELVSTGVKVRVASLGLVSTTEETFPSVSVDITR